MRTSAINIVMPVYNAEKYLKESINSILSQTLLERFFMPLRKIWTEGMNN